MRKIQLEVKLKKKRCEGWNKREKEQEVQSTGGGGMREMMGGDGGEVKKKKKKLCFCKKPRPSGEMELH